MIGLALPQLVAMIEAKCCGNIPSGNPSVRAKPFGVAYTLRTLIHSAKSRIVFAAATYKPAFPCKNRCQVTNDGRVYADS